MPDTNEATLTALFLQHTGHAPQSIMPLPAAGSDRRYYRLAAAGDAPALIGAVSEHLAENESFFYFARLLGAHGVHVPEVLAVSEDRRCYLQQDLGSQSLLDVLLCEGLTDEVKELFRAALSQLARVHWAAGPHADYAHCHAASHFDRIAILADLNYFRYYFADLARAPYHKARLAEELEALAEALAAAPMQTLMYRDFQSRNIMIRDGQPWLIDFQGAMRGPALYDVASLLGQARAQLPAAWKDELLAHYLSECHALRLSTGAHTGLLLTAYRRLTLLRMLQTLGAYGFRGLLERRPHFLASITPALEGLEAFLSADDGLGDYPELLALLRHLSRPAMHQRYATYRPATEPKLRLSVRSFSYKNGIPDDAGGHGGGYVFDCRGLLNPGRYEAYKRLTGQEKPVQQFLEAETHMPQFLDHVRALVSLNVEDYLARGFEHLSIAFGCTGGQHRSVYAAEQTARWLRDAYGVAVELEHLNRERWVR